MNPPALPAASPWLSTATMSRALGTLFVAGGLLALAWSVLPHTPDAGDPAVVVMAVLAVVMGTVLVSRLRYRVRVWQVHALIVTIQVVISVAYVASSAPENDMRLFYAWATPHAAFFFRRGPATAHSVWAVAALAISLVLLRPDPGVGLRIWLMTSGTVAAVGLLVGVVSARVRGSHHQLDHAAHHDLLTGLPNRRLFEAVTTAAVRRRDLEGGAVHVLFIDLDHFKVVNDSLGHQAGDELLRTIAPRLRQLVRGDDMVARMGGDEFAVMCPDPHGTFDLDSFLDRVRTVWEQPVRLGHVEVTTSGSVGVASATEHGSTAESLLRDADVALYRAKGAQRGSSSVFDAPMRTQVERRMQVDLGLRAAVERDELFLAYQPMVDLGTGQVLGAEALLRWRSATLGPVSPAELIPVAEDTGLIVPIGEWVLDRALAQLAGWRADGLVTADFVMSVNVSVRQLQPGFAEHVVEVLRRHGLPVGALALEITESVLLDETTIAVTVLADLDRAGVPLHLDDFGTGYSSLSYLQRIPLRCLKIDRSFVNDLIGSPRRAALVRAVLSLGESLSMDVLAEGVETQEQADVLRSLGCLRAQGYLYAPPVSADAFAALVAEAEAGSPLSVR